MHDQRTAPRSVLKGLRAAVCGRPISLFWFLQHLDTIRQQSEHRKNTQFRMEDDRERQEAPNDAENEDRGKSLYIAVFA